MRTSTADVSTTLGDCVLCSKHATHMIVALLLNPATHPHYTLYKHLIPMPYSMLLAKEDRSAWGRCNVLDTYAHTHIVHVHEH